MVRTIPGPRLTQAGVGVDAGVAVFVMVGVKLGVDVSAGGSGVLVAVGEGVACGVHPIRNIETKKNNRIDKKDNFIKKWGESPSRSISEGCSMRERVRVRADSFPR